jgi:hypothetical protein
LIISSTVLSWNISRATQFTMLKLGYTCTTDTGVHSREHRELWVLGRQVNVKFAFISLSLSFSLGKDVYWNCCECSLQNYFQTCPETYPKLIPEIIFSFTWMMGWCIIYFSLFDDFISNSNRIGSGCWMKMNNEFSMSWKKASCPHKKKIQRFVWKARGKSRKILIRVVTTPVGVPGTSRIKAGRISTCPILLDWSNT